MHMHPHRLESQSLHYTLTCSLILTTICVMTPHKNGSHKGTLGLDMTSVQTPYSTILTHKTLLFSSSLWFLLHLSHHPHCRFDSHWSCTHNHSPTMLTLWSARTMHMLKVRLSFGIKSIGSTREKSFFNVLRT